MTDKICKDCKHYKLDSRQPTGSQHRCNRPLLNLITGESKPHDTRCEDERAFYETTAAETRCCAGGKYWEPRV